MTIFLDKHSALEILRSPMFDSTGLVKRELCLPCDYPQPGFEDFCHILSLCKKRPASIALNGEHKDVRRSAIASSYLCASTPRGSFIRLDTSTLIASPELLFMQVVRKNNYVKALQFAYEMCGGYTLDKSSSQFGIRAREPICTKAMLEEYVGRASGMYGVKLARRVIPFVLDGSRSPKETALVLLLCLPLRYGGCGLPFPELNKLVKGEGTAGSRGVRYGDLVWADAKLVVEYDSAAFHSSVEKISEDSARRTELELAGFAVVSCTYGQLVDPARFDELAMVIARKIGARYRSERIRASAERREALRAALLQHL